MTGIYRKKPVISKERKKTHSSLEIFISIQQTPFSSRYTMLTLRFDVFTHILEKLFCLGIVLEKKWILHSRAYLCILGTADQNGLGRNGEMFRWNLFAMMPGQGRKEAWGWISIDYVLAMSKWSCPSSVVQNFVDEGKRRQKRRKPFQILRYVMGWAVLIDNQ